MDTRNHAARGFTLIELLVVVAIIGLLLSILLPALSAAKREARAAQCLAQLRVLGQGMTIYCDENLDVLPPSRLPKVDSCNSYAIIYGLKKFRPTFVASMSQSVGAPPFDDPKACKNEIDIHGEIGDRQNYSYPVYVCPVVPDWTDERNGSYGYNYQFLGNSRLFDENDLNSWKNWPIQITQIRYISTTVAVADCMGTAAAYPPGERRPYDNNGRDPHLLGEEGFNLDPPLIDLVNGEIAHDDTGSRTAVDPRHRNKGNVLWLDGHADGKTLTELGYVLEADGSIGLEGVNALWSGNGRDVPWTRSFHH